MSDAAYFVVYHNKYPQNCIEKPNSFQKNAQPSGFWGFIKFWGFIGFWVMWFFEA